MEEWPPNYSEQVMAPGPNVMLGITAGGSGDLPGTHMKWEPAKGLPYVPSPLVYRGRFYLLATGGFVTCADVKTGRAICEKERLGVGGEYYASPVGVGDQVLLCSERGAVFLIKTGGTLQIAHRIDLGEPSFARPAVVDNTTYLRSAKFLWAFSK